MRQINFYYTLDTTFKEGCDHRTCRRDREAGKNIDSSYYPKKTSIYLSWSIGGKYQKEPVGHSIKPIEWDFNLKLPSRRHHNYLELSVLLQGIKSRVDREYLNMRTNEGLISPDTIRQTIRDIVYGNNRIPVKDLFWKAFDEFLSEKAQLTKPVLW